MRKKHVVLRAAVCLLLVLILAVSGREAQAATYEDLNADEVFINQSAGGRCTLASAVMMMRRYALLRGDSDWSSITERAIESVAWTSSGLLRSFDYQASGGKIQVRHGDLKSGSARKQQLINLLKAHQEGIVLYRSGVHAVLLTDYDAVNDRFYCADPSQARPRGKILLTDSFKVSVSNASYYWYVASPTVSVKDSYTITFDSNGGSGGPETQEFVPGRGDVISSEVPTRTGYTFRGWLDAQEMLLYLGGDSIPDDWKDNELKAQWLCTPAEGWKQSGSQWWYRNADGTYPASCWKLIGGQWYHFDADGYMQTGWLWSGSSWYYLKSSGAMAASEWIGSYYLKEDGRRVVGLTLYVEGWRHDSVGWWYRCGNGSYPADCWKKIDGKWYHFDADGYMQTGWLADGSDWYYLKESGAMAASEWIGNYYLKSDGRMAVSEWVDGGKYYVDENGRWVPGA